MAVSYFNGEVGIGTTSPSEKLHLEKNANCGIKLVNTALTPNTQTTYAAYNGHTGIYSNKDLLLAMNSDDDTLAIKFMTGSSYSEKMRIAKSGNVGIGTTSPSGHLHIYGTNSQGQGGYLKLETTDHQFAGIDFISTKTGNDYQLGQDNNGFFIYENGANQYRFVVKDGGNLGIGTTSPGYKLDVAGEVHATGFPTSSDIRLKEDVRPLSGVLERLENIQGVSFDWNSAYESLGRASGHREIGLIAQEV